MLSTRLSRDWKPLVSMAVEARSMLPRILPTVWVMNCVLAAIRSWSSQPISTIRHPSPSKNCSTSTECWAAILRQADSICHPQHIKQEGLQKPLNTTGRRFQFRRHTNAEGPTFSTFSTLCWRSGDLPTLTHSYMKLRPCQLPFPLSGPNMGCVHRMSTCTDTPLNGLRWCLQPSSVCIQLTPTDHGKGECQMSAACGETVLAAFSRRLKIQRPSDLNMTHRASPREAARRA